MAVSSRLRPDAGFLRRAKLVSAELYDYTLPTSRIANRPLGDRSSSRLLVARFSEQADDPVSIEHLSFRDIASVLPARSRLVLNTSRVIPARIPARKESGARAEILLLNPADGSDPGYALQQELGAGPSWKCFIGGRRVREGDSLVFGAAEGECRALVLRREGPSAEVRFASDGGRMSLADALGDVGCTPLPPYIKRDADESDAESYQTVYASSDGSVAAPTAGLHVTEHVLDDLAAVGVEISEVTLHVGAGTFAQLGGPTAGDHDMHGERFSVRTDVLDGLIADAACSRHCIALGTTSVRTLESMYWLGASLALRSRAGLDAGGLPKVGQWEPYELLDRFGLDGMPSLKEAMECLRIEIVASGAAEISGTTNLLIVPGYPFQVVRSMITNFHQPRSTLLMLIAAFCGGDERWQGIYEEALRRDYRFLSYGDSSVLLRP